MALGVLLSQLQLWVLQAWGRPLQLRQHPLWGRPQGHLLLLQEVQMLQAWHLLRLSLSELAPGVQTDQFVRMLDELCN